MEGAVRALARALADQAGAAPQVLDADASGWLSATFTGMRHRLTIRLPLPAARRLTEAVAAGRLAPHGHLIVEAAVTPSAHDPTLLGLTVTTVEAA